MRNVWNFLDFVPVSSFVSLLFTVQVRWFYLRHEVEERLKDEMGPKEILMCDAESDQDLSTVSQKVSKSTHIVFLSGHSSRRLCSARNIFATVCRQIAHNLKIRVGTRGRFPQVQLYSQGSNIRHYSKTFFVELLPFI